MRADVAYETIRDQIMFGELLAGTKLVELDLAERLDMSRTPIRDALRQLELEGLVRRNGSTARVTEFDSVAADEIVYIRI